MLYIAGGILLVIIAALTQNKKASIFIPIECREREEVKAVIEGE